MTTPVEEISVDLLVVGSSESAFAVAVQALRCGVPSVALVSDTSWLGGQFSSEAVGPIDERVVVNGNSLNFPRSGLALEVIEAIRGANSSRYGYPMPGLSWSATDSVEPGLAADIFDDMLRQEAASASGKFQRWTDFAPQEVALEGTRVVAVMFRTTGGHTLVVRAKLTVDASDWGDVVRLSGAASYVGPDPRERFDEPSAPGLAELDVQEVNPITWTVTLRRAAQPKVIDRPLLYDRRRYLSVRREHAFAETALDDGPYGFGGSVFTSRRLVDTEHLDIPDDKACIQLNWAVQDYPLSELPGHVVEAMERVLPGSSRLNIADMPAAVREIVYEDARAHSLGFLYYLQTETEILGVDVVDRYRSYEPSAEFGTSDRLPPKPYVREGRRLAAVSMVSETDVRAEGGMPLWGRSHPDDGVLGFQFHIDFHPTRRRYPHGPEQSTAWLPQHTPQRNWDAHTDRVVLPLGCFVPESVDGLVGAGKTIGVSSIVQSAMRLHCQMVLVGQVAGMLAAQALSARLQPRAVVADRDRVRDVQLALVRGRGGHGVLIWPWQDLSPTSPYFEAVSMLSLLAIWPFERANFFLSPEASADDELATEVVTRLKRAIGAHHSLDPAHEWRRPSSGAPIKWSDLAVGFAAAELPIHPGLAKFPDRQLLRGDLAKFAYRLWNDLSIVANNGDSPEAGRAFDLAAG